MIKKVVNRQSLLALAIILIGALASIWAFSRLPIEQDGLAIDWKQIWAGTHTFQARYGDTELRSPPWILPLIWPFSLFGLATSWALLSLASLLVLVLSVPKNRNRALWYLSLFTLILSYPALRQIVDGNIEAVVVAGALLAITAFGQQNGFLFALGLLLLGAKIQESWLLLPALLLWQFQRWPKRERLQSYAWALLMAAPLMLWKGASWVNALINFPWPGTAIDSSLQASIARLAWAEGYAWLIRGLIIMAVIYLVLRRQIKPDRLGLASLICASLLAGPYAASNSVLSPFAIGVIPLLQQHPKKGLALAALYFIPYLFLGNANWRFSSESNYWTLVLFVTLNALLIEQYLQKPSQQPIPDQEAMKS